MCILSFARKIPIAADQEISLWKPNFKNFIVHNKIKKTNEYVFLD